MWHKAIWKGHPMRHELTRVGLLVQLANHHTTKGAYFQQNSASQHSSKLCQNYLNLKKKEQYFENYDLAASVSWPLSH